MKQKIEIVQGDITKQETGAIVNAANKTLLGGGGVDGAIHRAAGRQLYEECRTLYGCETGEAKITNGYNLKAKYVIHTVGPVWNGGKYKEEAKLKNCYENSLRLAVENNINSISFPAISTGVYRFPADKAVEIAVKTVINFPEFNSSIEKVVFVCFDTDMYNLYVKETRKYM
jgi:O-acetyl-ADP-ribose deacetylase